MKTAKTINLAGREVGEGRPVYVICEGGVTNYGKLALAKKQTDAAREARADIVKFQVWKTENLISKRVAKRLEGELGYDWFSRVKYKEISFDKFKELEKYVNSAGMGFFATAHEDVGLDFLDKDLKQPFFKIGSGEAHNFEFLKNVGQRKKPVIISFGLQSDKEILKAVDTLRSAGTTEIIALHCTTSYPTLYEKADISRMSHLKKMLGVPVGISDHTVGWHVPLAAVALGACVVEKHITFDKNDPRSLDNPGALLPEEFKTMVSQIRDLERALKPMKKKDRANFLESSRDWAGQSIVASRVIMAGSVLKRDMITFKRPAKGGLAPEMAEKIIGKKVRVPIEEDEQILLGHLE